MTGHLTESWSGGNRVRPKHAYMLFRMTTKLVNMEALLDIIYLYDNLIFLVFMDCYFWKILYRAEIIIESARMKTEPVKEKPDFRLSKFWVTRRVVWCKETGDSFHSAFEIQFPGIIPVFLEFDGRTFW